MRIAVLGAGVTGVTAAYYLSRAGHEVTVLERASAAAAETSHANGAQLSYSYTDPLAQPAMLKRLPSVAMGGDPAIRMRLLSDLSLYAWGQSFLRQCTTTRARENMLAILDLALRSARLLEELEDAVPVDFHWRRAGKLVVLGSEQEADSARRRAILKQKAGCNVDVISPREAADIEPAIAAINQPFAAAVYSPDDEVGDACTFSVELARWLETTQGVRFEFGCDVDRIDTASDGVRGVIAGDTAVPADAVVVSLGPWSQELLRPLGIALPIYPIRGYSVTLPAGSKPPQVSVTSVAKRIVWSLLGDRVRIAGFADFVGFDTSADALRIKSLLETAREVLPQAADYAAESQEPWGGFRPVTPDSRPLVGATRVPGLYLNTGHGVLGWTLACATAADLAAEIGAAAR